MNQCLVRCAQGGEGATIFMAVSTNGTIFLEDNLSSMENLKNVYNL